MRWVVFVWIVGCKLDHLSVIEQAKFVLSAFLLTWVFECVTYSFRNSFSVQNDYLLSFRLGENNQSNVNILSYHFSDWNFKVLGITSQMWLQRRISSLEIESVIHVKSDWFTMKVSCRLLRISYLISLLLSYPKSCYCLVVKKVAIIHLSRSPLLLWTPDAFTYYYGPLIAVCWNSLIRQYILIFNNL